MSESMSQFLTKEDLYKARSLRLEAELSALQEENKKLREALEFYANDGHVREYSYGQMVMLESEECEEGEDEKILPNRAGRVLASLNETK